MLQCEDGTTIGPQEGARCSFMAGAEEMLITLGQKLNVNENASEEVSFKLKKIN